MSFGVITRTVLEPRAWRTQPGSAGGDRSAIGSVPAMQVCNGSDSMGSLCNHGVNAAPANRVLSSATLRDRKFQQYADGKGSDPGQNCSADAVRFRCRVQWAINRSLKPAQSSRSDISINSSG